MWIVDWLGLEMFFYLNFSAFEDIAVLILDCGENVFEAAFLGLCQRSPGKDTISLNLSSLLRDLTPSQHCKAFYGASRHSNSGQSKRLRRKSDLRMFHPMSRPDASLGTASPSFAKTSSVSCQ